MFNFAKFFAGFAFWKGEKFGKILFYVIMWCLCAGIAWGVYWKIFLKEDTHSTTNAQTANQVQQPKFTTFGCSNIRVQESK